MEVLAIFIRGHCSPGVMEEVCQLGSGAKSWTALQIHDRSPKSRPIASINQQQTQLTRPVLECNAPLIGGLHGGLKHCLQVLTAETIKIRNSDQLHEHDSLIHDQRVSREGG